MDISLHLLTSMDNIDSESVHCIPADVVPVHPGDEHLPLVVVAEEAADHGEAGGARHGGDESGGQLPSAPRSMTSAALAAAAGLQSHQTSLHATSLTSTFTVSVESFTKIHCNSTGDHHRMFEQ